MNNDSMLNKREFDVKDKDIAEFIAFINNKTISQSGNKLYLADSKDVEKQIRELFKNEKYLEANQLLEKSKDTINQKKYLDLLLSTKSFSYRYTLLPYLRLVNKAIKQKSNVSTIVKKEMCEIITKNLKEQKITAEKQKLMSTAVENWEKNFKEKEWTSYNLFEMTHEYEENLNKHIGTYEFACEKIIMSNLEKYLKKIGMTADEIEEFISFLENEDETRSVILTTSCDIVGKKPALNISISISIAIDPVKGYFFEEKIPYGNKIVRTNIERCFEDLGPDGILFMDECTIKTIPLEDILKPHEKDTFNDKLKQILFPTNPLNNIGPDKFEEIKKILPQMAKYKLEEKIADGLLTILTQHSNVVTLSAPKIIPIAYRAFTGKKMNR